MTPVDWAVVVSGVVMIAWMNWYLFRADKASATAVADAAGYNK